MIIDAFRAAIREREKHLNEREFAAVERDIEAARHEVLNSLKPRPPLWLVVTRLLVLAAILIWIGASILITMRSP